ncbi:MAG: FISUMP domain-containing protein [Bacteroidales bacterium]
MNIKHNILAAGILFLFILLCCKKEEVEVLPAVDTASVDEINNTSARVGGKATDNGGPEITERGIYWGTTAKPEETGTKMQIGSGSGTYYEKLTGLNPGVKYYVTAYATTASKKAFGRETFFTTQISLPEVQTSPVTEYTSTTAKIGGNVIEDGGFAITRRGVYWGTEANPRLTGTMLEIGSGKGSFSTTLTGLDRSYSYHVVAFATNLKGTSYGEELIFSTAPELPVVFTASTLDLTPYSANSGGIVSSNGGTEVTERGIFWGTTANPMLTGTKITSGTGTGNYTIPLTSLLPGTTYYVRAYATNSIGTAYGEEKSFLTPGAIPVAKLYKYTDLTPRSVKVSGKIKPNELNTTVTFEYGETTSYGKTINADVNPVTVEDTVYAVIRGLDSLKTYHFRVKAVNDLGVSYSHDTTFKTVLTGVKSTVTDIDGNTYNTIGIGYQEWITENLRTTKFNNGTAITLVDKDTSWIKTTTPAYCWFENNTSNGPVYGGLYNWYAAHSGNLCPTGFRVPKDADLAELIAYVGGAGVAGGLLKDKTAGFWNSPNTGASDKFGFKALGAGKRFTDGTYDLLKVEGNWWIDTEYGNLNAIYLNMLYNYGNSFQSYTGKKTGMSIRCVK